MMKIAVTSQNRREVTEHAGRCRKFWLYEIDAGQVRGKELLELPREQAFHESDPHAPHPLDGIDALITGGMGQGMVRRLAHKGIAGIITDVKEPDSAVSAWLAGTLQPLAAGESCHHDHGHHH